MDWRSNIEPAVAELRRLRAMGLTIGDALDKMRGRGFTLPAIIDALKHVEGMDYPEIHQLFDNRGDWDDF